MMWELVYADGQVSEFEDNVVWRAADLLACPRATGSSSNTVLPPGNRRRSKTVRIPRPRRLIMRRFVADMTEF